MENQIKQIKCTSEEHKEIDAISFCPECKIYMCNKCQNYHSSPLFKSHHPFNLNKEEEIFTGFCKEKNHPNRLEYFCKEHNQLCCAACIAKLNDSGDGQHKDCNVCNIKSIKDEKKNKLKENIKSLEDLSNSFNNNFKEIKESLDKGKKIDKEWDNENLISYINECINIENNIKSINIIQKSINKYKTNNKVRIEFSPNEESLNDFIKTINTYGRVYLNIFKFRECPPNINNNRIYTLSGDNKNILTKTGTYGYYTGTICEYELDKSIEEHKWKIKILKTKNKSIMVGVAPSDFDINSSIYNCGWYFYCYDLCLYSGPPFKYSGSGTNLAKVDNEIILVMNMKKRSLKFIINGEDKGDSYTNIPMDKSLYPAVILYHTNDSVEITDIL